MLFPILQNAQLALVIQQIENLSTVDLKEGTGRDDAQVFVLCTSEQGENIRRRHGVDPLRRVLIFPHEVSPHRVSFPTPSLPVGETGCHAPFKDRLNQGLSRVLVHQFIVRLIIKCVVKAERREETKCQSIMLCQSLLSKNMRCRKKTKNKIRLLTESFDFPDIWSDQLWFWAHGQ